MATTSRLEHSAWLRQSSVWSRAIAWGIVGVTSITVVWASVSQIEEAIPATGKLAPQGAVKDVQAPVNGLVTEVYVKDGQRVKQGDLLLKLDPTSAKAQASSLQKIRAALQQETAFYRNQLNGAAQAQAIPNIPADMLSLTKNRAAIAAENRLYRSQLTGGQGASLNAEEQLRLSSRQTELSSRLASDRLEAKQVEQQFYQTQTKLANAHAMLGINQKILNDLKPLVEVGGIARLQFLKQQQDVSTRQAEVDQLAQEQTRLALAIDQAKEKLRNTAALSQEDLLAKITNNEKSLADIDSQITKAILEDEKRLAEVESQLSQAQLTLKYQELRAPIAGTVFDLKPKGSGFVSTSSEPLLKIVPGESLIAEVYITNKDIGFVREGMEADIRIDSFPFHEFGDIKGTLIWVGSDALPPDQIRQYYHFPAKIRLNRQHLLANNRALPLQSGMSVNTNIKLRKRTVLSIFTDMFMKNIDSLKFIR
ncbi:HlyD family efflux transporter periplasmic adaptor subunit [Leptolyngbya sp. DQ-M1]|uniref:HlyD family efflux transporter periplasmic adaptor subunit n=1 Tax=Leptolyngbya sp. DQ-M1 TaxID=2933920 RepID=UPI00329891E5